MGSICVIPFLRNISFKEFDLGIIGSWKLWLKETFVRRNLGLGKSWIEETLVQGNLVSRKPWFEELLRSRSLNKHFEEWASCQCRESTSLTLFSSSQHNYTRIMGIKTNYPCLIQQSLRLRQTLVICLQRYSLSRIGFTMSDYKWRRQRNDCREIGRKLVGRTLSFGGPSLRAMTVAPSVVVAFHALFQALFGSYVLISYAKALNESQIQK